MCEQYEMIVRAAKDKVRFCTDQQTGHRKRWKDGLISKEEYLKIYNKYNEQKKAIQSLFRSM